MAFGSPVESDFITVDTNFEAFQTGGQAIAVQFLFGESAAFRFHVDAVGTSDNIEISVLSGQRTKSGLGIDAGTTTTIDLNTASDAIATDNDLNSTYIVMTSGGEAGEFRLITDSTAANDRVTLDHALSGSPTATETYDRYTMKETKFIIDMSAAVSETNPHNDGIKMDWQDGEFIVVRARATGATNAHRIRMSYQKDGGVAAA